MGGWYEYSHGYESWGEWTVYHEIFFSIVALVSLWAGIDWVRHKLMTPEERKRRQKEYEEKYYKKLEMKTGMPVKRMKRSK